MPEGLLFENITIDKNLTPEEQEIIDALGGIDISDLKKSLKEEKISGIDQTFYDAAIAFTTYNVQYKEGEKSTDDWGNEIVTESGLVCDETAPQRLKDMLADKDQNDFAYFIYKTSEFLSVGTENIEQYTLTKNTKTQLVNLQTEIEKEKLNDEVVVDNGEEVVDDNNEESSESDVDENKEEQIETITADEITINNLKNGVTKEDIVRAVEVLTTTNPTLANEIIPLLKTGSVKEIQIKLGMEEGNNIPLYKRADGLFGTRTLQNLRAGQIIEKSVSGRITIEDATKNIESIKFANTDIEAKVKSFIENKDIAGLQKYLYKQNGGTDDMSSWRNGFWDGVLGSGTLRGIEKVSELVTEKTQAEMDAIADPIIIATKNAPVFDTGKLDIFGNKIINITTIDQLPKDVQGNYKWTEKKTYQITKNGVNYKFYNNGRVVAGNTMKNSKYVIESVFNNTTNNNNRESAPVFDTGKLDVFGNKIINITTIDQLPKDAQGNYKWEEKNVYDMIIYNTQYRFYGNGRIENQVTKNRENTKDFINEMNIVNELEKKKESKEDDKQTSLTKTIEKDKNGNDLIPINDISELPLEQWDDTEKKAYTHVGTKTGNKYTFYGNGRVYVIWKDSYGTERKNTYNRTDLLEKKMTNDGRKRKGYIEEDEYPLVKDEMDTYIHNMNTALSVSYYNDTKTFTIWEVSGIKDYEKYVSIDLKNNTISYLGIKLNLDAKTPYKEVFALAAKIFVLINEYGDNKGSFRFWGDEIYFTLRDSPPDRRMDPAISLQRFKTYAPTVLNNLKDRNKLLTILNEGQDAI